MKKCKKHKFVQTSSCSPIICIYCGERDIEAEKLRDEWNEKFLEALKFKRRLEAMKWETLQGE
jgi:hypothetical protein